jgi:hypothetical protein
MTQMGNRELTRQLRKGSDRTLAGFVFFLGLVMPWAGVREGAWWVVVGGVLLMIGAGMLWWIAGWRPPYPGRDHDLTEFRRATRLTLVALAFIGAAIAVVIVGEKLSHSR